MSLKKINKYFLIIILIFASKISVAQNAEEVFIKCVNAVGLITDFNILGSGFFVNENTFITNRHISNNLYEDEAIIKIKDGKEIRIIKKIFENSKCDLAAYQTEVNESYLKIAKANDGKSGEKVYAIGNPTSNFNVYEFTITEGIINNITNEKIPSPKYPIEAKIILHSASLNKGNSGGPLVNSDGELIGINSYFYTSGNNQFIAIHFSELTKLLDKYNIKYYSGETIANLLPPDTTDKNDNKPAENNNNLNYKPEQNENKSSDKNNNIRERDRDNNNLVNKLDSINKTTVKYINDNNNPLIITFVFIGIFFIVLVFINANSKNRYSEYQSYIPVVESNTVLPEIKSFSNERLVNQNINYAEPVKSSLNYNGSSYKIAGNETTIGRGNENDCVISHKTVSRIHCRISSVNNFYYITDLNSKNGTFVNGNRVLNSGLNNNDVIRIGEVEIIFKKYK